MTPNIVGGSPLAASAFGFIGRYFGAPAACVLRHSHILNAARNRKGVTLNSAQLPQYCGGVFVAKNLYLTAASCSRGYNASKDLIILTQVADIRAILNDDFAEFEGTPTISSSWGGIVHRVTKAVIHPATILPPRPTTLRSTWSRKSRTIPEASRNPSPSRSTAGQRSQESEVS
jgi:hypothetical protein